MSERLRDILLLIALGLLAYLPGISSLPVIDRDEARYAQSVVQMIETGDYLDIRFQDEARYKKPVGAYWAQSAAIHATGQADDVRRGERAIWVQRLPSVIGALAAVIFTYLSGLHLFARREALVGASLLAISLSLIFEAHQAKTDALLAGACAAALYGLVARKAWALWPAIAVGVLLKGPVIVGVVGMAVLVVAGTSRRDEALREERGSWRWALSPLPILIAVAIALPWFVAIGFISDGAFYAEALGRDFGAKLGSAQETHGGPPGYYLLATLVMFWPGVIALPVAGIWAWRNRSLPAVALLLAWVVPMWLVLELVPTKLPHYTLPLYPALALLCGAAVVRVIDGRKQRMLGGVLFIPMAFAVLGLTMAILTTFGTVTLYTAAPDPGYGKPDLTRINFVVLSVIFIALATLLCGYVIARFVRKRTIWPVALAGVFASIAVLALGTSVFRGMGLATSHSVANALPDGARVVSPDYREPSLVYLAGTDTKLSLSDDVSPGEFLLLDDYGSAAPACATGHRTLSGYNYAKGQFVDAVLFRTDDCAPAELETWRAREAARRRGDG